MARDDYKRQKHAKQQGGVIRHVIGLFSAFLCGYLVATVFDLPSFVAWVNQQWADAQGIDSQAQVAAAKTTPVKPAELPKPKFEFYTLLSKDNVPVTNTRETTAAVAAASQAQATTPAAQIAAGLSAAANPNAAAQSGQSETAQKPAVANSSNSSPEKLAPSTSPNTATVAQSTHNPASVPVTESKPVATSASTNQTAQSSGSKLAGKETYMIQVAAVTRRQDAERLRASLTLKGYGVMIISPTQSQAKVNWFRVVIGPFHSRSDAEKAQLNVARTEHIQGMIRKVDV